MSGPAGSPAHQPPDLAVEHRLGIHEQDLVQHPGPVKQAQDIDGGIGNDDVPHQAGDSQAGMEGAEEIWRLVSYVLIPSSDGFWLIISLMFYYWLGESLGPHSPAAAA